MLFLPKRWTERGYAAATSDVPGRYPRLNPVAGSAQCAPWPMVTNTSKLETPEGNIRARW